MRFALLGEHPDGVALARALAATGRHELIAHAGRAPAVSGKTARDPEEVLADPAVELVIVANRLGDRAALLRRALQSERHVLCVYPPDQTPDPAYEAALIQGDTGRLLLPIVTPPFHPAIIRLAELIRSWEAKQGRFRLLQVERRSAFVTYPESGDGTLKASLPGWDVLRALGGEIAEVSAFAAGEEVERDQPLLVAGRFERGGLFQESLVPGHAEPYWRFLVQADNRRAELVFPGGLSGPSHLSWSDATDRHEERWDTGDPWPAFVAAFESAAGVQPIKPSSSPSLSWHDAIRSLELDDAARRSVERRRASMLEYPEASEAVGFKGTMTLVGCGMLWGILVLLILANWFPLLKWVIPPVLVLFLVLQFLRWLVPGSKSEANS